MAKVEKQTKWPGLGSISTGTMLERDLIPAFLDVLTTAGVDVKEKQTEWDRIAERMDDGYILDTDKDNAGWICNELFDALDGICPAYVYFGASEGDGADYGFWIDHHSLEWDCQDGIVYKADERPGTMPDGVEYALVVNDHGNMSLYDLAGALIWDCV